MSVADILAQVVAGKLSQEEATKLLAAGTKSAAGLTVSLNKSGGVYIRHPKFVAHSAKKDKNYVAGINLDAAVARVLFGDEGVYREIATEVMAIVAS